MRREDSKWWSAGFTREWWDTLTVEQRHAFMDTLSDRELVDFHTDWRVWGRDNQLRPDGNDEWDQWLLLMGRGTGKASDVNTPVPTPSGWTTLGDLSVGDQVFDESGRPCTVTGTFEVPNPESAYRLTFSDGTHLDVCGEHQWVTWTHAERKAFLRSPYEDTGRFPDEWPAWRLKRRMGGTDLKQDVVEAALALQREGHSAREIEEQTGASWPALAKHLVAGRFIRRGPVVGKNSPGPQIRTTQQIVDTLTYGKRGDLNHCIPVCGPLQAPEADLPVHPYVLGAWLGDGSSAAAEITTADEGILDEIAACGEVVGARRETGNASSTVYLGGGPGTRCAKTGRMTANGSLRSRLRALGVLKNKHVPAAYLRASAAQRQALLQGLMDTDGYADVGGSSVEFCSTRKELVDAVVELARSLGQKPVVAESRAMLEGRDCGPRWRVTWRPTVQVFRLQRKLSRVRPIDGGQALRNHHRMIVKAEPINPVPMRCISVDSPHRMYLLGEGMIPTHNTRTGSEQVRNWVENEGVGRLCLLGQGEDDVREVMIEGESSILACSPPWFRPKFYPSVGSGRLEWPNGATAYVYSAADPEALRGPQFEKAWVDEPMAMPAEARAKAISNLRMGLRLGKRPQIIYTTTPKPHRWLTEMVEKAKTNPKIRVTRGTTHENAANLAPTFLESILDDYDGTALGRQELYAEILGDEAGALFLPSTLDKHRILPPPGATEGEEYAAWLKGFARTCERVVVGVDPNIVAKGTAHAAGIVPVGLRNGRRHVLADYSTKGGPLVWANRALDAYEDFLADEMVVEVNQGGDLVKMVIEQAARERGIDVKVAKVRASKGKQRRAEPVAAAYEQGKVAHMGPVGHEKAPGPFYLLEKQLCALHDAYDPTGEDFDRADALVWAATRLSKKGVGGDTSGPGAGIYLFSQFGSAA